MNKSRPPADQNRRVLVIDDNRAIHDDFRKILCPATLSAADLNVTEAAVFGPATGTVAQTEFEVDSAYQGQEGVLLAAKAIEAGRPYAMAFVDVRMPPGWDGVETTRKLWELDPNLQVVLCTAYSDYSWGEMFEKLGQRDGLLILKKPFDAVEAFQLAHALTEKWWLHRQSRKKMEDMEKMVAERTSELQWKTAFLEAQVNSTLDGILVVDQEGKQSLQNHRFVDLFKIPRHIADEKVDENRLRWVKDMTKYPEQFLKKILHLYAHPDEVGRDEIELKNGTVLDRYSSPVVGKEGKYYGRIWTFRDITERKQAQEALEASQKRLRELIDGLGPSMFVGLMTPQGILIEANRPALAAAGLKPEDVIGKPFEETYWWTYSPEVQQLLRETIARAVRGEASRYDVQIRVAENHLIDIDFSLQPVRDETGAVVFLVPSGNVITERKRAENALRESNEKFHQLADNITDAFWIRSPDMSEVQYVSPAFEQIWGRPVETLYANPHQWADYILPEDRERVLAAFVDLTGDAPSLDIEYRILRPHGEVRWVRVRGFQVRDATKKLIRHIGIVADITERKRLETHLIQSQKMETVGKLAGGIAHEFNSILTTIIGQSEMLLNDLPAVSPLAKNAIQITKSANRAATLTRQLLAFGRKQFLQPEVLDLNAVIAGMNGVLGHLMGGEMVDVNIVPAAGLHLVKADAGQIEQVIMNLAMNAHDAMPGGGKLTLETANVILDQEYVSRFAELKPGAYVMLAISDNGSGMSEAVKARVFEPFFTTKGVGEGTGLGLSTCYGIIKQSGGHISVYSEPGRGTTFKIYLPQMEAAAKIPIERLDSPDLPRGAETILLVEDDSALREMGATLLRRLGYTVLAANQGVEALSLCHQRDTGHIDLLFTDVVMPHMSGKELADRVRVLYPRTKILFTSAYTENAIVHQGVLDKGVALLQKPFTPSALARKVREVLDAP